MNTLSINTSTNQYSLAVMKDEILLGEYILPSGPRRFSNLMPAIDDLLIKVGLGPGTLDGLIVALGPGSFTGIRIGLAVVKGLSQCLAIPIIGVPTLLAMASQLPYSKEDICPLVTSRKGEVFTGLFRWNAHDELTRLTQDTCLRMSDLSSITVNKTIYIGNDLPNQGPILKQQLGGKELLAPANLWSLRASSVGILGVERLRKGESDSVSELVPIYLREADTRVPKKVSES
jgi:tRNA threonylcarbamoyladenosine biosynthesis protein TsaB